MTYTLIAAGALSALALAWLGYPAGAAVLLPAVCAVAACLDLARGEPEMAAYDLILADVTAWFAVAGALLIRRRDAR